MKYGNRVEVISGFNEGFNGEVVEIGNLIRVQNK